MSMPSDSNADVAEAVEAIEAKAARAAPSTARAGSDHAGSDHLGLAAAALVAFVGIALVGPAITRLLRPKSFKARDSLKASLADQAAVARHRFAAAGADARRRGRKTGVRAAKLMRRLGGGTIRR